MEAPKVYFTDFRTEMYGAGLPAKLKKLLKKAGFGTLDLEHRFVAVKMHFGELGNVAFLRPNYAKAVADLVKEMGGRPFLTDANTLYPGSRKHALEHLETAWENGFSPLSAGCPVLIADGLKGTDDVAVPVRNGVLLKEAKIGRAVMDADVVVSLTHFKGHEATGFGGALKNIGMGCASRAGKSEQHSSGKTAVDADACIGCRVCYKQCANGAMLFDPVAKKMRIDPAACVGCGRCIGACAFDAIAPMESSSNADLNRKIAEYAQAVLDGRPHFHASLVMDISPNCDCHGENDAPILPDVGMFASFDPVALDQACVDACRKLPPMPNSQLADNLARTGFVDLHDPFRNSTPESEWKTCLAHAERIGLGRRDYTLVRVK